MAKGEKYISLREYARLLGCSDGTVRFAIKEGKITDAALKKDKKGRNKGIDPTVASAEWAQTFDVNQAKNSALAKKLLKLDGAKPPPPSKAAPAPASQNGNPVSKAKAQQVDALYKAKIRELEYKEKAGILVNKDQVYKALFALGREIREGFQAIPDRFIDEILAAGSRNASHKVLQDAIDEELTRIADLKEVEL